jgi:hypothetical protein
MLRVLVGFYRSGTEELGIFLAGDSDLGYLIR